MTAKKESYEGLDKSFIDYGYLTDDRMIEHYAMPMIKKMIGKDKRILDVGMRSGFWLHYYCNGTGNKGVGIDLMGDTGGLREDTNIKFFKKPVDATFKIPFEDNSFDVVTCTAVLEHLWVPGDRYAVENMIRVAKEKVILMTPIYTDHPDDPTRGRDIDEHINMFDCKRFKRFLKSFGYKYRHYDIMQGYRSHIGVIYLE